MQIKTTKYYDEFLRYFDLAKKQQDLSNLGHVPHAESKLNDELMHHIELYDVVERKFAGFSQIINDCFYGWNSDHPYWSRMNAGLYTPQRKEVATNWNNKRNEFGLEEWLYIFILHRVCGSAINYATKPSGYHNTILFNLHECSTIEEMCEVIKHHPTPFYTSVGYQFPAFPKPPKPEVNEDAFVGMANFSKPEYVYKRGGDYFLCEFAPRMARDMANFLRQGGKKDLRELGEWMFKWNTDNGLRAYRFQYAAVIADVCDWYPEFMNRESMFYYGTNAVECIGYLADPVEKKGKKSEEFLDAVMTKIYEDTGSLPYNAEDVACDFIRWIENYLRPGADYAHINMDTLWNSSEIKDHPFGRQKAMLDLGLVETFNGMTSFPSDDKILQSAGVSVEEYKKMVSKL
ncbi:MAG: hypothetical protein HKN86_05555 [Acidimicrobiia bacterium]|nr:hypothetical protein [Acidimicrobiia bacterium]